MGKSATVAGDKDFKKYYDKLNEYDTVKLKLDEIIHQEMNYDINKGDLIKHRPYPKKYDKHKLKILYVYNLPNARRLIYTVLGKVESGKTYVFLEVLTHKEYDVAFGYHTNWDNLRALVFLALSLE